MRGLIFKTTDFYSQDTEKSNWPPVIKGKQDFDKKRKSFKNVICVWVCVEKDDTPIYIDKVVKRINSLNEQFYGLSTVIVMPFGHLSSNLAHPDLARQLIDELATKLKDGDAGLTVERMSFGTHKLFGFDVAGHRAAVSYFEFPYNGRKPSVE